MTITSFNYPEYLPKIKIFAQAIDEAIAPGKTTIFLNQSIEKAEKVAWLIKTTGSCELSFITKDPTNFADLGTEAIVQTITGSGSAKTSLQDFGFTHLDTKVNNTTAGTITVSVWLVGKGLN